MRKIGASLRSMARLLPLWFTIFAAIFLAANYAAGIYLRKPDEIEIRTKDAQATFDRYGSSYFQRVYPGKSRAEIVQLIRDQAQVGSVYEPYAEFRPSPYISPTLNIHPAGFRLIGPDQGPWPIDTSALNIFVFGGSMAMGAAVADEDTISARLQAGLRERTGVAKLYVYNFAAGSHFSSQEVTYFQNKLRAGIVPDIALFIDGQNDFYFWNGETEESSLFRQFVASGSIVRDQRFSFKELPFFELARLLHARLMQFATLSAQAKVLDEPVRLPDESTYDARYHDPPEVSDPARIQGVIDRYLANKKIAEGVASAFHIQSYLVWQPSPFYKYDLSTHPKSVPEDHRRARYGYPVMAAYVQSHDMGDDFAWCADVQQNIHGSLYADIMHYNPEGNRLVADCIMSGLLRSGIFEQARIDHTKR